MCFVPDEPTFNSVLDTFLKSKKPFTSLEVKRVLIAMNPHVVWNQTDVGNELRARFNRGELGARVAVVIRDPVVHISYDLLANLTKATAKKKIVKKGGKKTMTRK